MLVNLHICTFFWLAHLSLTLTKKKSRQQNLCFKVLKNYFVQAIIYWDFKDQRANSVDPDEAAHYELPHLDLHCLQIEIFSVLVLYDLIYSIVLIEIDGWLEIYILFNSVSVISGWWEVDIERLCAVELRLQLRRFRIERGSNSVR